MRKASSLLLPQFRRPLNKTHFPFIPGGGDSFSGLHSLPSFPIPGLNGLEPHSISTKHFEGSFVPNFMKMEFLSRKFCTRAFEIEEKKDLFMREFQSAKTVAEKLVIFEEMESMFEDDEEYIAGGYWSMGRELPTEAKDPEKALTFATRAVELFDKGDNELSLELVLCLNLLGQVYEELNWLHDALGCFKRALGILDSMKENDTGDFWSTLNRTHCLLLHIKRKIGRNEEAVNHLAKSLEIREKKLAEKPKVLGFAYMDLAEEYANLSKFKEALPFGLKALDIHIGLGSNPNIVALVRRLLAKIYTGLKELEKASEQVKVSLELSESGAGSDALDSMIDAAKVLIDSGRYQNAMEILEAPLTCAYKLNKVVPLVIPELQLKIDEARKLWRICEEKGFQRLHYEGNELLDLGKGPNIR
ncbi:OLC1v1007064C1 [Oldenlandia corymbosa var. corymbosa]|uniref:OLC1v1007064C1 n=1 Tax=Oldenlandia corymbosa var. corymbosa TaxID=529605 RepID=A0AAV1DJZ4_OLDCO|nr:OLC1v1007064C1 [Oldenlandia corymbosa var. corymbosa]